MTYRMLLLAITLLAAGKESYAQKSGIFIDLQTHLPVAEVQIRTNTGYARLSDKAGRFSLAIPFSSITVTHAHYVMRVLNKEEMKDTIYLLPKSININEVTIIGRKPKVSFSLNALGGETDPRIGPVRPPSGMNFLGWLSVFEKGHVSKKEREKRRKAIENY